MWWIVEQDWFIKIYLRYEGKDPALLDPALLDPALLDPALV